ncbi:MAG: hypothetical protein K5769_05685 [Pseudobutyrivibrio sp.]|nr:hypothetical protein [Pseudobutyrivibrio sp.]
MKEFKNIKKENLEAINGGGLAGGLTGGILGGTVGLVGATIKGVATGELSGNELWKATTAGALSGAAIGGVGFPL